MWSTLDRTRRRLLHIGTPSDALEVEPAATALAGPEPPIEPVETVLAIGRPELDRLGHALQVLLGDIARPDTPDRLQAALAAAVIHIGGVGEPRVNRRPAGLYTPEAWQVHIEPADPAVLEAIRRAIRDGVFAA